ncbi:MAG TPA: DEAD/DEAH box helicase [Candidatus Binatia bacterium]
MSLPFHPLICRWFNERFGVPTAPQEQGWEAVVAGRSTLIAAPTGSGKTLAAFLWSIDRLFQRALRGELEDATAVVYVSPLKALGNDIAKNLQEPLAEIFRLAYSEGLMLPEIRTAVRSGDTPAHERQAMVKRPPHILITTPESLYILLTAPRSREFLKSAETVIVDEIHAVADDKRGAHLALSLERLEQMMERPVQRIGLSATQKPIEEVARLLVGTRRVKADGTPECAIIDVGHKRALDLRIEAPEEELGAITSAPIWSSVYDKIVEQVKAHRTTLVFVNTRRLVERVSHQLTERLGEGNVGAHHGSLSRKTRLEVESKLKSGQYPVVVATASLELGIDIGNVDVVCHIGSARTLAILLQRVGRSGHWLGAIPKGIFYPLTRDDLMQCAAGIRAVGQGELDQLTLVEKPLDVLAQQMVAIVASLTPAAERDGSAQSGGGIGEDALFDLVRGAYPYRNLGREEYEQVLEMLSEGISTRRSRRSAYIHRDRIHAMLRARRGARLTAITNGGAIPDTADYDVIEFPSETFVGKVNEDFAIESLSGDIFLLGNRSWRIRRVGSGKVYVEDAQGLPPTIPFWLGEAPPRSRELSEAVSELRREVAARVADAGAARDWLMREIECSEAVAEQIVSYVAQTCAALGAVPTQKQMIAERFFDESGGMQLVIHSPWGGAINRAWGLALRKRFCVSFDRELQAAATDDGIVISLVEQHSFPVADVFHMLRPAILERELTQAVLVSPFFTNRWRWNATRALALLRHSGGKKVPMALQRMRAEDLLAAVFPQQVACQDNNPGPIEIPEHPLIDETLRDCLYEAMNLNGLKEVLGLIDSGQVQTMARDTAAPSPMAHEILNANPYAFLDDAPLEERRARAVSLRRVDPAAAGDLGQLDPAAIAEVSNQAWPEIRNSDELHDFLLDVCILPVNTELDSGNISNSGSPSLPVSRSPGLPHFADQLIRAGRVTKASWPVENGRMEAYVAAERCDLVKLCLPDVSLSPPLGVPLGFEEKAASEEEAFRKIIHGWIEVLGPATASELSRRLGILRNKIEAALIALESDGIVLRGYFRTANTETEIEWCERRLLARIHRLTLGRLRKEIESVSAADFMRFLLSWQHVAPDTQLSGRDGVLAIIRQLQGLDLPAPAWEQSVLPARVANYDPADLEHLCLGGVVTWGRLRLAEAVPDGDAAIPDKARKRRGRRLPIPTRNAPIAFLLRDDAGFFAAGSLPSWQQAAGLSEAARAVGHYLEQRGASFISDIARATGLLKITTEEALWQLVAQGYATGDGIAGLRVLLTPETKRADRRHRFRVIRGGRSAERVMPVGRWSLWRYPGEAPRVDPEEVVERWARQLLARYGVVFRDLLARKNGAPPWRKVLQFYRRLEARGEIRGGRFVTGFVGEQFALPEAVEALRAHRRVQTPQELVTVSASDPLNLVGILSPGPRISPYSNQVIAYRDGLPVEVGTLGAVISRLQRVDQEQV